MFPISRRFIAALALSGLAFGALPALASVPAYTYAYTGLDFDSDETIDETVEQLTVFYAGNSASAQIDSAGGSSAFALTGYGVNQAYAGAVNPPGGLEQIGALSVWSDVFQAGGGSGTGSAQVSVVLNGSFTDRYYSASIYTLFQSDAPLLPDDLFNYLETGIPPQGITPILFAFGDSDTTPGPVQIVLSGNIHFTYGSDYYLTSILMVGASDSGEASFAQSADFGITLTSGGEISTASGTAYAAAVPEPETWAMLLAGAGLITLRLRRK